ncbi:MAG TPA: DUF6379 domain-containing protein [Devosia sp.]|nr:DUF6379 domain-containing protein [Devosia sp.]
MPVGTSFWIAEGMLAGEIENLNGRDEGVRGYRFPLRNRFLHGHHPLGWIRALRLAVDGIPIAQQDIFLVVREQWIGVSQVPTIYDIWWQINETIHVAVAKEGGLASGLHALELVLTVTSLNHTPVLDHRNLYPTLEVPLSASLQVAAAVNEGAHF